MGVQVYLMLKMFSCENLTHHYLNIYFLSFSPLSFLLKRFVASPLPITKCRINKRKIHYVLERERGQSERFCPINTFLLTPPFHLICSLTPSLLPHFFHLLSKNSTTITAGKLHSRGSSNHGLSLFQLSPNLTNPPLFISKIKKMERDS